MKYIKLFENFESYDPYELMILPPNKKAEMIMRECGKSSPNLNLVSDLIVLGANLDWQDEEYDETTLHVAARFGEIEIAQMLIDAKADLNLQDEDGETPLHLAAFNGYEEIVRMLIDAGTKLNVQNEDGNTPLHYAVINWHRYPTTYEEIAEMLIDAGARKDIRNEYDDTPYDLVRTEGLENLLRP
jgi:ankyrin repeat protein